MAIVYFYIRDFFGLIGLILSGAFDLFLGLIKVLIACAGFLKDVVSSMPVLFGVAGGVLIIICVLYKVLGREGGQ